MKAHKLPSGSWRVQVTVGGHRYSFTDTDKRRVVQRAAVFADEHREAVRNPSFKDAMEDYISTREKVLSPATIRRYRSIQKMLLQREPAFCEKRIINITEWDVQHLIERQTISPKTLRNYAGLIQASMGRKLNVRLPEKTPPKIIIPTDLEVKGLMALTYGTELEIPVLLAAFGPLRRGEICALTMDDIDGNIVSVTKSMVRDTYGNYLIKPPKTYCSNRRVAMPPGITDRIRELGHITDYKPHQITNYFVSWQERAGVDEPYHFHCLRHYCVSTLHAQGVPDEYIMERGGWATPHVLQDVYRHTMADQKDRFTDQIMHHFDAVMS